MLMRIRCDDYSMEKLHAVRFVSFNFQAIQCLSFSSDGCRLALSRNDGSIEVWSVQHEVFVKKIWIPGRTDTSIEAIQWCDGRLFTGCLSGMLILIWVCVKSSYKCSQNSRRGVNFPWSTPRFMSKRRVL